VDNPEEIRLLANFIRREILQLLSERPMTLTELSRIIGLTKASIGYHLKRLKQANIIYIKRTEVESHGILQKIYSPIANIIIARYDRVPDDIKRYFIQMQIEHLIGMFAVLQLQHNVSTISSETIEDLAEMLWKQFEQTCKKYEGKNAIENTENFKIMIYADALKDITTSHEWKDLLSLG
jgi:predicted transcriptional regulator